jgi:hypothetical protein
MKQFHYSNLLGLIPVHEDINGQLKFKLVSWKTAVAFTFLGIIPTTCRIVGKLLLALEQSASTIMEIADIIHIIQTIVFSLICPILTANLVEKSKMSLNRYKLSRMILMVAYTTSFIIGTVLQTYAAIKSGLNIAIPILYTVFYTLHMIGIVSVMLVITFVSSPIIDEGNKIEITDVDTLIVKSVTLVEKTRNIKQGFSPILFSILSGSV